MLRIDEQDILASLYAGPLESPLWSTFLERLRRRLGAVTCALYFRHADAPLNESTELYAGAPESLELRQRYNERLYRLDPIPYDVLRPGRVYSLAEFVAPANPEHEKYLREFVLPGKRNWLRVMKIEEPGGYRCWLTIWKEGADFTGGQTNFIGQLAQHITVALRIFATIDRWQVKAGIAGEAVRRLNFGWLTLDAHGHIIEMDPHAEHLLRHSSVLRQVSAGQLMPASRQADKVLRDALKSFASDAAARARAIRLSEDPWIDILLVPIRQSGVSGERKPIATAYIHGDRETSDSRIEQLMSLFGLSQGEARLALGISRGQSIAEAAAEIGLTEATARNYSKIVYSKTGARGQADLVRIILTSVAILV
ncbi:helix-turn-helix transcriptional regulator [Sphingomonas sp. C3-2]|uniref:helix-turn-helix transcriptional regulator n=1 Tax=Sphingomonas sp. C3-2 TaxID=3062169 RepID=UPI00294B4BF1|nr:helix-turn-helix transcriptional regulator [Sphingomonas sp. C3-2]WOK37449.1 helix-turn-helix transcriptional regulator [Sphingomonas sp. C3-2]